MFHFLKPNLFDNVEIDLNNYVSAEHSRFNNNEIKKKFSKAQVFDPDDCYTPSVNEASSRIISENSMLLEDKELKTSSSLINKQDNREDVARKIINLKFLSSIFEIIAIILIISSAIISLVEYEISFKHNFNNRIFASLLINSLIEISDQNKTDINIIMQKNNLGVILNITNNVTNERLTTNEEIINTFNLKEDFNFDSSINSYKDIAVPLNESVQMANLRWSVLVISYLAGKFII